MTKIQIAYLGEKRTSCRHLDSGEKITTDAPIDNNGKGSYFSPTDMLAASYISCMMTIIGIFCEQHDLQFIQGNGEVQKTMLSNPRRVGSLDIELDLRGNNWTEKDQQRIKNAAKKCPVAQSVSTEMKININFIF